MRIGLYFGSLVLTAVVALAAPSAKDVLAANRAATGDAPAGRPLLQTEYALSAYGLTGTVKTLTDRHGGWSLADVRLGSLVQRTGYDGAVAWDQDASGVVVRQIAREAKALAVNQAYRDAGAWWSPDFGGAEISASEAREGGRTYAVLKVTPTDGRSFSAWFDAETHLLYRTAEMHGSNMQTTTYSGYVRKGGVMMPGHVLQDDGKGAQYLVRMTLTAAEFVPARPRAVFAPPQAVVADAEILGGAAETTVPVRIINNHIYGRMSFDGHAPVTAIFDTGGMNLASPSAAAAAGLKSEGAVPVGGVGKDVMQASISHAGEIRIGDAVVKRQQIIVLPLDSLSAIEGVEMPAMAGFEIFRRFVTRIDYAAGKLTLIDPKRFDPRDAGTPVPFVINGRIPQVKGTIEGFPAVIDIDTGSRSELSISSTFEAKNHLRDTHKGVEAITGWGVGGPNHGYATRLQSLRIGPIELKNVVADISTLGKGALASAGLDGNLGSGILKRFIVTFDYGRQILYLKPQPLPVTDVGTYDRAGIWTNLDKGGFVVVAVTKGSPAEKAGILAGDVVAAVDGLSTDEIEMSEFRSRLRCDPPGTQVRLTVLRGGKKRDLTVTLQDQI